MPYRVAISTTAKKNKTFEYDVSSCRQPFFFTTFGFISCSSHIGKQGSNIAIVDVDIPIAPPVKSIFLSLNNCNQPELIYRFYRNKNILLLSVFI